MMTFLKFFTWKTIMLKILTLLVEELLELSTSKKSKREISHSKEHSLSRFLPTWMIKTMCNRSWDLLTKSRTLRDLTKIKFMDTDWILTKWSTALYKGTPPIIKFLKAKSKLTTAINSSSSVNPLLEIWLSTKPKLNF